MNYMLRVNGQAHSVNVDSDTPLLWVLRDVIDLKGTKFGCGAGLCGACTVHLDGAPARSCVTAISDVGNAAIMTIEGIGDTPIGARVQKAWLDVDVVQCGYCQAGPDHVGRCAARADQVADRPGHRRGDERQHLPLRDLSANS